MSPTVPPTPSALPGLPKAPSLPRRGLWVLPLALALVFAAGVAAWGYRNELDERAEQRRTLISDALSLEAQLRTQLESETARLRLLAARLPPIQRHTADLAALPEVSAGFRRLWLSLTWLDDKHRIVAQLPDGTAPTAGADERSGISSHLVALVQPLQPETPFSALRTDQPGERIIARYAPATLLRRGSPWWLTSRYEIRLVDGSDQVIASVDDTPRRLGEGGRESYRVQVGAGLPGVFLELTPRSVPLPWWRHLPLVQLGGFLVLIGIATALLRRQVQQVSHAEVAWRTEANWRSAMEDSALVALRARDAEGRLLYVNRTFCEMVGLPAEQLVGRKPPMPYWPPDAIHDAMGRSQRNLAGLAPREGYEARWCHRDGHLIDVMVFESPLIDAAGQQIGWMGSILDITARKRLEERERHQAEAMAHQARLTTLGEVASALAHQLNQPLTVIASYNSGVLRMLERAGFDNDTVLNALRRQGEQVAEAGRIVQRIRGFLTRRAPQRERCDLPATLHRAVKLLQRDWRHQPVRIDWDLPDTLPEVLADAVLIEQVTLNLVRNAMDACLGAQRQPVQLRIGASTEPATRHVEVRIEDNGPGLQARTIEELTAPFYSTKAEGMGMGLAICRSVIEAHRGKLDACASSELGGACFRFTLPIWSEP